MSDSKFERETIISYNEAEPTAHVYTASETVKRRLEKLGDVVEVNGGWEMTMPKSWVTIKAPK